MSLLMLAAAAAGIAQPAIDPSRFDRIFAGYEGRSIAIALFIDPEGVVVECEVRTPSVSDEAKERICARAVGRDVGQGARGMDGEFIHGEFVITRILRSDHDEGRNNEFSPRQADFEILVESLPGNSDRREVNLLAYFDEQGHVGTCQQLPGQSAQLSSIACTQSSAHTFTIRHGADGQAVPYVGDLQVDFVSGDRIIAARAMLPQSPKSDSWRVAVGGLCGH